MFEKIIKENIKAIHDDDLEMMLDKLGILKKYRNGELKCNACKSEITFHNLHSLFVDSGNIKFICDNTACIRQLSKLLREGAVSI